MPAMCWASGQSSEQGLALKEHKDADGPFQWAEKTPGTRGPDRVLRGAGALGKVLLVCELRPEGEGGL